MEFTLTAYLIGLLSSVVTELFKLFPKLKATPTTTAFTAIAVMFIGTLFSIDFNFSSWDWNMFGNIALWSFLNYKMLVQPVAKTMDSRSQGEM